MAASGPPSQAIDKIEKRDSIIASRDVAIDSLKRALSSNKSEMDLNVFSNLYKDAKIQFSDLEFFGYAKMLSSSNFRSTDTISIVKTKWNSTVSDSLAGLRNQALKRWIEIELDRSNIEVISN